MTFSEAITHILQKLKIVIDKKSDIGHKHTIANGDLTDITSDDLHKLSKIVIKRNGDKFLSDNGTYKEPLTTDQKDKLDALTLNSNGTKFLADDGVYKEIDTSDALTEEQKNKLKSVIINGDGESYLSNNGTYKKPFVSSEESEKKLNAITINSDGKKCLYDDGIYRTPLTSDEKGKIDKIQLNGNGDKVLSDNGTYKVILDAGQKNKIDMLLINGAGEKYLLDNGTYKEPLTTDQKNKIYTIINGNDGTKFLADDGTYKEFSNLGIINDTVTSKDSTFSSDNLTALLADKADLSELHEHANKKLLDDITLERFTKWDEKSNAVKMDSDGNGFLANDGTYKSVAGLSNPINNEDKASTTTALSAAVTIAEINTKTEALDTKLTSEINKKQTAVLGMGLTHNDFTNDHKLRVDVLNTNGVSNKFLGEDGLYHEINNSKIDDSLPAETTTYSSKHIQNIIDNGIKNIVLPTQNEAPAMWTRSFDNVTAGQVMELSSSINYEITQAIIQVYQYINGSDNITKELISFQAEAVSYFYHNPEFLDFTEDNGVKIRDSYNIPVTKNENGYYESALINKDDYIDLRGISLTNIKSEV